MKEDSPYLEDEITRRPARTYWEIVQNQFFKNKIALVGLLIVFLLFFVAIYAPFIASDKPFLIHRRPLEEYRNSWNSLWVSLLSLKEKSLAIREEYQRAKRLSSLKDDYRRMMDNSITVDGICKRLEKGEEVDAIKKYVRNHRVKPFTIGDQEESSLSDAGADDDFISYLRNMDTKFDAISLDQVIALIKKGLTLAQVKSEIAKKRINPFFYDFDKEDEIRAAFSKSYGKTFKNVEDQLSDFLNYLTKYKVNLAKQFKKIKNLSLKKTIQAQRIPIKKQSAQNLEKVAELALYLPPSRKESIRQVEKSFTVIWSALKNYQIPSLDELVVLAKSLKEIEPRWGGTKKEGGVAKKEIPKRTSYPAFRLLSSGDIFFMVLFLVVLLSKIPFFIIDRFNIDDFTRLFVKFFALFTPAVIASLVWFLSVSPRQDNLDYRKIIQNFKPGDYAWIQPVFYSPTYTNTDEKFVPPSWVMPSKIGIQSLKVGDKKGIILFESFEVPSSEREVSTDKIRSPFLADLRKKYQVQKHAFQKALHKKLYPLAVKLQLENFIDDQDRIKKLSKDSKQLKKLKDKVSAYKKAYDEEKENLLAQYEEFTLLKKKLNSVKVVKSFAKFSSGPQISIPKGLIVYFNHTPVKTPLKLTKNLDIQPGATLIFPSSLKIEFDYQVPRFHWGTTDCKAIYNYHFYGTDALGRDIFSRMIWGARISLSVGFVAVGIYVFIGIILGSLAGFFGGWVDLVISRMIEVMICFPSLVLIITVIAVMPRWIRNLWSGMLAIMVVIGLTGWTGVARLIRGEFLRLRGQDFVVAGKALGVSNLRLIFRHIVPNALAPVLVSATFGVAAAILTESGLSFLGLGVQPPTATWGEMLAKARGLPLSLWWLTLFPGLAIFVTVTVYNLVGEGFRDAIDPRLKER